MIKALYSKEYALFGRRLSDSRKYRVQTAPKCNLREEKPPNVGSFTLTAHKGAWRQVVSFTLRQLYPVWNIPVYPLDKRLAADLDLVSRVINLQFTHSFTHLGLWPSQNCHL
jgi:hypothetical protein